MSNLADKTEYQALKIIARMMKDFERLYLLDMTATDYREASQARNLLERIIESNGYNRRGRGQSSPVP